MKALFVLIILLSGITSYSQKTDCRLWLGDTYDSIDVIKKTTEQYLQAELKLVSSGDVKTMYEMQDKEGLSLLKVWMKGKKTVVGSNITTIYNISSVRITGLAENVENLFRALKARYTDCTTESTPSTLIFGNSKITVEKFGGDISKKNLPLSTLTLTAK